MTAEACVNLVRKGDPYLHATAMFAPEPDRTRLMVLYAYDVELSRAAQSADDTMIPQIRLQWWYDTIQDAIRQEAPERHEVAGPLVDLIGQKRLDPELLLSMISGHARELDLPMSREDLWYWAEERFAARLIQAALLLTGLPAPEHAARSTSGNNQLPDLWRLLMPLGQAMAAAYAIEHAAEMAARGRAPLLPDLDGDDRAALARGELPDALGTALARRADRYLRQLAYSRAEPLLQHRHLVPALLPLVRTSRVLELVNAPGFRLRQLNKVNRPFDGLRLAWRAKSGRW